MPNGVRLRTPLLSVLLLAAAVCAGARDSETTSPAQDRADFSPAPNTRGIAELVPDAASPRRDLRLLYLSCGNQDGLISVSQAVHRGLVQRAVPHLWNVDDHGHDRESWAENLYRFAQLVFR